MISIKRLIEERRGWLLGALIFLSFLFRLFTADKGFLYPDSCLYLSFIKSILTGKFSFDFDSGVEAILPVLYPVSSAMFAFITGDVELSGILVSAIAGAFLIIPVYYLAGAFFNEKAAWVSAALVFLSPILTHWSRTILTESLFITLFVAGIAAGWYAIEKGKKLFFFFSIAFIGLSYMTRVIGLVAIPVLGFWIIFYAIKQEMSHGYDTGRILKKAFVSLAIVFIGFMVITGVYLVRLHSFYGKWTLAGFYGSITGTILYEGAATTGGWEKGDVNKIRESPYTVLVRKVTTNIKNYSVSLLMMSSLAVVFIVLGLFYRWKVLYLVSFMVVYFAALLVQPLSPLLDERIRYLSPIFPLLLIVASGGIVRTEGWIKWQWVRQAIIPLLTVIVLLSFIPQMKMFPVSFNKFLASDPGNPREKVGLWMKENLPHPIRVMSRKPFVPYYADGIWFRMPPTYDEVINLAHTKDVDYIVVDRSIDYYLRPELRFLFNPEQVPDNLKYVGGIRYPGTGELVLGLYKINR